MRKGTRLKGVGSGNSCEDRGARPALTAALPAVVDSWSGCWGGLTQPPPLHSRRATPAKSRVARRIVSRPRDGWRSLDAFRLMRFSLMLLLGT